MGVELLKTPGRADSSRYGALAEHLAVVELLSRGHKVAIPVVDDDGVDLVVNYSVKVQVKNASRLAIEPTPGYKYDKFSWRSKRRWLEADIFLLHGLDSGRSRWWVVPADAIKGSAESLAIYMGGDGGRQSRVQSYENAWHVFDA